MDDLGAVLESIRLNITPDEDVRISDAILITKQVNMSNGETSVRSYVSEGTDLVTIEGMLSINSGLDWS